MTHTVRRACVVLLAHAALGPYAAAQDADAAVRESPAALEGPRLFPFPGEAPPSATIRVPLILDFPERGAAERLAERLGAPSPRSERAVLQRHGERVVPASSVPGWVWMVAGVVVGAAAVGWAWIASAD